MSGREDYKERKKQRIERYKRLSQKAKEKSEQYMNSNANRILSIAPGQPILIGHHSERKHRKLIAQADNDIRNSIKYDDISKEYDYKAKAIMKSKVIYNDDPNAIEKLKEKLKYLEQQRKYIKEDEEHTAWQLQNIGAQIREVRKRIEILEKLDTITFEDIEFMGGKAIHNKEINRIQLFFDDIPNEEIRKELKSNGFHWSRNEGAWQRLFNENTIRVTNRLIRDVLIKENEEEEEFE